jgi:hypothetical protein
MNTCLNSVRPRSAWPASSFLAVALTLLAPALLTAQGQRRNPASKVYVTDVSGEAIIDTGETIADLTKRAVYTVQGSVIETKKPETAADRNKYFSTMVFSNGTGAFFDADTRVEVKRFMQEPFTPNRNDLEVEPSISQTQAFLARGAVGLCTSKLVAGSNMTYVTPLGSVSIRGRKLVIETSYDMTKVSMLEGESTVRAGPLDPGGHTLKSGEQAVIRRGPPGQANSIEIQKIPSEEGSLLDDRVAMACMARKTVYFEVREKQGDSLAASGGSDVNARNDSAAGAEETKAGGATFSRVNAFDGTAPAGTSQEIVPVEIIPTTLPVEYTVSTASLTSSPGR